MQKNELLSYGLFVRSQIHTRHFQTHSFSEHKALDEFYTEFLDLFDGLVETYQGIFSRVKTSSTEYKLEDYQNLEHTKSFLSDYITNIKSLKQDIGDEYSDLQNILDELIALGNKTLYLLTLS